MCTFYTLLIVRLRLLQAQKELLDTELDLYKKTQAGEDTAMLRIKYTQLQIEVTASPTPANGDRRAVSDGFCLLCVPATRPPSGDSWSQAGAEVAWSEAEGLSGPGDEALEGGAGVSLVTLSWTIGHVLWRSQASVRPTVWTCCRTSLWV